MSGLAGKLLRALIYSAATGIIALALLVGLVRLLLPLVPEYQQDIRRMASEATGLVVDFDRISASWPLRGPQLQLYGVTLSTEAAGPPQLVAGEVTIGISLLQLLTEQAVVVRHVGVSGSRVEIERAADGRWQIQGRPLEAWLPEDRAAAARPDTINLHLEDIQLGYQDRSRDDRRFQASLEQLRLELDRELLKADGNLVVETVSGGGKAEFSASAVGRLFGPDAAPGDLDWQFSATLDGLDLPRVLHLATGMREPLEAAEGRLVVGGRWRGTQLRNLVTSLDLRSVKLAVDGMPPSQFDAIGGTIEWEQRAQGWLLASTDLQFARDGEVWPRGEIALTYDEPAAGERSFTARASFIRVRDIYDVLAGFATARVRSELLPGAVKGDLRDIELQLSLPANQPASYALTAAFDELGIDGLPNGLAASNLSGQVVADQNGGRLTIESNAVSLALPGLLLEPVPVDSLSGFLIWRVTADQVRVLSDNIRMLAPALAASTRFELSWPRGPGSAYLDMDAEVTSGDASGLLAYLPLGRFPAGVTGWLRRSIRSGEVRSGQLRFDGPLREFPFDSGEGVFRADLDIVDARLEYADGWPAVENLSGIFTFDGVSLYSRQNQGLVGGLQVRDRTVLIPDLRQGLLEVSGPVSADVDGILDFLRATPVAAALGPPLARVSGSGPVDVDFQLRLPIRQLKDWRLDASFQPRDASLQFSGVDFGFEALRGTVELRNTRLSADNLTATLLGEPVTAKIRPATLPGNAISHYLLVEGSTPAERWFDALKLPFRERVSGEMDWRAMALVPAPGAASQGLQIVVGSELQSVSSTLPEPLAKRAGEVASLGLELGFPSEGILTLDGRWREKLGFALLLELEQGKWRIERGEVRAGDVAARLPDAAGLTLSGRLPTLRVADWMALPGDADVASSADGSWLDLYREASWQVDELHAFGQVFRDMAVDARRDGARWRVSLDGPAAAGTVMISFDTATETSLQLDFSRLWLQEADVSEDGTPASDPRAVPRIVVAVDDFRISEMQFGRLRSEIRPTTDGITASPLEIDGDSFAISGDGAWVVVGGDPQQQRSRLRASLISGDIKSMLQRLGYAPVIEGEKALASTDLSWPGPPTADFLHHASGSFRFEMEKGALLELEPGGGRLLGIVSIASLPRRLALDFRDVFDEGLAFDKLQADFSLEDGNAYTCNLGLEGSVADLGMVGRTGFRDEDYDQLAVVRPHVSNMLAIGGTVVGGPGVGAAMFLISQIFRKPLSQLGESYYMVTGPWSNTTVERVPRDQVDATRFRDCARQLATIIPEDAGGDELVTEPGTALPREIVP